MTRGGGEWCRFAVSRTMAAEASAGHRGESQPNSLASTATRIRAMAASTLLPCLNHAWPMMSDSGWCGRRADREVRQGSRLNSQGDPERSESSSTHEQARRSILSSRLSCRSDERLESHRVKGRRSAERTARMWNRGIILKAQGMS